MEEDCEFRHWDELIPDALGLIFSRLPLQEVLTVVPRVCKAWNRAVIGPYCWQEIDIELWSNRCHQSDHLDRMLQMLIHRSSGSLRKLSVTGLRNDSIFSFIAQNAGSLKTLKVPRSGLTNLGVVNVAEKLSSLTFLDLSYCCKVGPEAIQAIGIHCKSLREFCRNMHPLDVASVVSHDDEAYTIANTMPKLKRLEIAYNRVSTEGVLKILSSCIFLEFLELRGCWDVQLDNKFFKEKFPDMKVLGPRVIGFYDMINDWEDCCSDYFSDGSDYLAWEFLEDGVMGEFYKMSLSMVGTIIFMRITLISTWNHIFGRHLHEPGLNQVLLCSKSQPKNASRIGLASLLCVLIYVWCLNLCGFFVLF